MSSTINTTNIKHASSSANNLVLASDGGITFEKPPAKGRQVLEQFFTSCDGTTITTTGGDITVSDVTAEQDLTESYVTCSGSSISYTPPAGTTQVIYEYQLQIRRKDTLPLIHFRLSIGGTEVTNFRRTQRAEYLYLYMPYKYCFHIGGSTSTATGRQATWTSAKTIMLEAREYSSAQEAYLHSADGWDGSSVSYVIKPSVGITAIG